MKKDRRFKIEDFGDIMDISRLSLMSASSSVLALIGLPVISRIYHPVSFGAFFSLSLIITIAAIFLTGRYESAIITIPTSLKGDRDLQDVIKLISQLLLLNSHLFFIFILGVQVFINSNVDQLLHLVVISFLTTLNAVASALTAVQYALDLRLGNTKIQGTLILSRALILLSSQISLGFLSSSTSSLLTALLLSNFPNLVRLIYIWPPITLLESNNSRSALKKFSKFPKLQMPGAALSALFFSVFFWGFSFNFGRYETGILAMALRFTYMPVTILSSAVNTIYLGSVIKRTRESNEFYKVTKRIIKLLVLSGVLISIANIFFAHFIARVLGPNWLMLENFLIVTSILCPSFVLLQILNSVYQVIERQDRILIWNLVFMIASFSSVAFPIIYHSNSQDVILFFGSMMNILVIFISFDLLKKIRKFNIIHEVN